MKRHWWGAGAIAAVLIFSVATQLTAADRGKAVEVEPIARHTIRSSILASGAMVYEEQSQLTPEVIGKVVSVLAREGDKVERGQVVLKIDDETYRAEVEQRHAAVRMQQIAVERQKLNLSNAERQFDRAQTLFASNYVARTFFDDQKLRLSAATLDLANSQEALRQARASLQQGLDALNKTIIRAPSSGVVTTVAIRLGETTVPSAVGGFQGSNLLTIANVSSLIAELNVDEADISQVRVGQEVSILPAASAGRPIKGVVRSVALAARNQAGGQGSLVQARTYTVKVALVGAQDVPLRPGMTCRAEIYVADAARTLAAPVQALLARAIEADTPGEVPRSAGRTTVSRQARLFIADKGVARERQVSVGEADDDRQAVLTGVGEGETIIVGPYKTLRHLRDGDKLKVQAKGGGHGAD